MYGGLGLVFGGMSSASEDSVLGWVGVGEVGPSSAESWPADSVSLFVEGGGGGRSHRECC